MKETYELEDSKIIWDNCFNSDICKEKLDALYEMIMAIAHEDQAEKLYNILTKHAEWSNL